MIDNMENNNPEQAKNKPDGQPAGAKTFTQDDVNRIVQERLARERAGAENLDAREADLSQRETALAEREAAIAQIEKENLLKGIAAKSNLPEEMIPWLRGDTEDDLLADAQALRIAAMKIRSYPQVRDGGDPYHIPRSAPSGFERDLKHVPKPASYFG